MDLTDQQWNLIQPLLTPPHAPNLQASGRPPIPPRPVLDAILWKIRHNAPWYDLPNRYPSHQTCYRRYHHWRRAGLLDRILSILYQDLLTRGHFDPLRALHDGTITITRQGDCYRLLAAAELLDTWQLSTALVYIQLALKRLPSPRELLP